jgi:predicted nucleotidyltransferase
VDVLVDFGPEVTFERFMDLRFFLEDLLGRKVDLVMRDGLRRRARPVVEREEIRVA